MEVDSSLTCDLCRVSYSLEQELQEHNWSLMHHIKIEQSKKGAPHSCNLCMETCANLIEYGKHLNGDKHKIALSRLSKEGPDQILNSMGLIPHPRQTDGLHKEEIIDLTEDREQHSDHFKSFDKRSRSQLQPVIPAGEFHTVGGHQKNEFKHPSDMKIRLVRQKPWRREQQKYKPGKQTHWTEPGDMELNDRGQRQNLHENGWSSMNELRQHWSKNDVEVQVMDRDRNKGLHFYDDNFGVNWNDNKFYSEDVEVQDSMDRWMDTNYVETNRGKRRGSLDDSVSHHNKSFNKAGGRRGRDFQRGRNHVRTHSYDSQRNHSTADRYSPESNSSSDSNSLKRRLEDSDAGTPEKARRKNFSRKRNPDFVYYGFADNHKNFQVEKSNSHHRRSRSSSRDKTSDRSLSRNKMSQTEIYRPRSSSQNSLVRRVTWSDQQRVSSTTDIGCSEVRPINKPAVAQPEKSKIILVTAIPDSSTDQKKKKKQGRDGCMKSPSKFPNTLEKSMTTLVSDGLSESMFGEKDSTGTVLEKAEKLCKKLRNEREKIKQQKLMKEKQKKIEKNEELNVQIAELSNENRKRITGHLESTSVTVNNGDKQFDVDVNELKKQRKGEISNISVPLLVDNEPLNTPIEEKKSPSAKTNSSPLVSGDPNIAARIAQTRADIDAIRAKIEGSVQADTSRLELPSISHSTSPLSDKKKPDNQSLLRMVNAPRTTRERLHVAQLLRNHAKSQSKFSLPRFNLKMSDLVENKTELEDLSEFSIEALEPSVQLEIANLIEADIKPDVTELQVLLDAASSQNAVVDSNILSELGFLQTPDDLSAPRQEDYVKNSSPVISKSSKILYTDFQIRNAAPEGNMSGASEVHQSKSPHNCRKLNETVEDTGTRDDRPSLSVEELVTEVNKAKEHLLGVRERERNNSVTEPSQSIEKNVENANFAHSAGRFTNNVAEGHLSKLSSSLPISTRSVQGTTKMSSLLHDCHNNYACGQIKAEKEDSNYDKQSYSGQEQPKFNRDSGLTLTPSTTWSVSSTHSTVHTMKTTLPVSSAHSSSHTTSMSLPVSTVHTMSTILPVSSAHSSSHTTSISVPVSSVHTTNTILPVSNAHSSTLTMNTAIPVSSISRSVQRKGLFSYTDELPVRDTEIIAPESAITFPQNHNKTDSTVDRVNAILNAVPNMNNVLTDRQMSAALASPVSKGDLPSAEQEKDKQLDSSVNSNTSSVLDQVYSICVEEDNIRSEITSVDAKIEKLKSLISEAQTQLETFTERRKELTNKESQYRSSRMKLLQENRSLQGSSGSQSGTLPGATPALTETQIQDLNNPVLVRFLMSQRQSDLSSLGGYSNVESGSQPEDGQHSQRRGSISSFVSEQTEHREPGTVADDQQKRNQNTFFSQSIDILSGSTDTLNSLQSQNTAGNQKRDSGTPIPTNEFRKNEPKPTQKEKASKTSFSMLKPPMEKFVTLEALMNGDKEIGQLIHKSLESIQKGEVKEEEKVVIKTPENHGSTGSSNSITNRRESALSVGSDDMCISGSDTEKLSGKVSMKYMGALPGGTNYDSIVKQISSGSRNKPVMFTVVSSPEPMITGKSNTNVTEDLRSISTTAAMNSPEVPPIVADFGMMYKKSPGSDTTSTVSLDLNELESQSARSNFSLGEQIKRICDEQTNSDKKQTDLLTPRSESSGEKTLEDESSKVTNVTNEPIKECSVVLDRIDAKMISKKLASSATVSVSESSSPLRKRLKSKKERDQKSRRKQKETFILQSDTNSEEEKESQNSGMVKSSKSSSKSEEELVLTGSEDARTSRENCDQAQLTKRSLLDEVQLETETLSESGEEKLKRKDDSKRLDGPPKRPESFRDNVKTEVCSGKKVTHTVYKGPSLSVTAIQLFKGEVFVCYNGSELRRFDLKTGTILRELDCSPYLVNCLHVTSVDKEDLLFTAGPCKKVMVFDPVNFNLVNSFSYLERITCLHENWGRLFIGLSDGSVPVRSLKADKELNMFSCTTLSIHCMSSTSAGMTKMLCLGTGDKIIYVLDAITGLLLTMLEGHTLAPLCIQVMAEKIISCSADHTILVHDVSSGHLLKSVPTNRTLTHIWTDGTTIFAAGQDDILCLYDQEFNIRMVLVTRFNVTYGIVGDKQLFLGYRNGTVEACPVPSF